MRDFLTEIAIFVGFFWRSFTKSTFKAVALACFVIISLGIVANISLWILFNDLVTREIALNFLAFQIIWFIAASLVWFMILSGRGILVASIVLFLAFLGGLNSPTLEMKIAGLLAVSTVSILLIATQKREIELFLLGARERLKNKKEIIGKWSSSSLIQQCDILLLMASAGSGHMVAAKNIAKELERVVPDKKVACINIFDYLSSGLRNLQETYWEYLAIHMPNFYRPIHRFILWNFKRLVQKRSEIAATLIQKELKKSPLVIIATHPMSTAVGSALKKITGSKLVVVPTDYYVHPHYVASNVDLYCLPSDECFFVGVKKGEVLSKSVVTGIPVSVAGRIDRYEARKKLGIFDDAPVAFVNFGGIGTMRPKLKLELISLIMFCDIPCHFLLSDIANETLGGVVESSKHFGKASCHVINDVQLTLSASDVMIGKVGGISISEAMAYGVPIGIWTHAGPEDFNAKFLIKKGLGVKIGGFRDFFRDFPKIKKWITKPTI